MGRVNVCPPEAHCPRSPTSKPDPAQDQTATLSCFASAFSKGKPSSVNLTFQLIAGCLAFLSVYLAHTYSFCVLHCATSLPLSLLSSSSSSPPPLSFPLPCFLAPVSLLLCYKQLPTSTTFHPLPHQLQWLSSDSPLSPSLYFPQKQLGGGERMGFKP